MSFSSCNLSFKNVKTAHELLYQVICSITFIGAAFRGTIDRSAWVMAHV
jgi:hypothetical protein